MERDWKELIARMTLEEKAGMCSGLDFWHLKGVERLGIPSIMITDGPHGLRKQREGADHLGLLDSVPATCFPSAAGLASSWDQDLVRRVGVALGEECQAEQVAVLLGPGANIKRSPLCGRNFEYFSEDPYLSSEMAAGHIRGVQSQGVGTSLKHFAVNNQEHRRMTTNAVVDERTLREIYLASFEGAVKKAQPWTVMCSYNQVNGTFASENVKLLTDILKDEWGHEGFVVSDWGAVNRRDDALAAGLELEMPASNGVGERRIVEAVASGKLSEEALDRAVERLLRIIFMAVDQQKENAAYDQAAHHALAREVASESMVLLKNDGPLLPLSASSSVAVIGAFAQSPRYQGGGSSHIVPTMLDNPVEEMKKLAGHPSHISYAQGYRLDSDALDEELIAEAQRAASAAQAAVVFAGLPDRYESEAYDRSHLNLPENQIRLIEAVAQVQSNIVVVLLNGAPVVMPWIDKVKAVLEGYLGGQAAGGAIADLIYGVANPSGKLAETFPVKLSDNPSYLNFPGEGDRVEYREGIFVGYRYYDKKQIQPLFPFGYGLSYTSFEYGELTLGSREMKDTETLDVAVAVTNTGSRPGKEIVQLYVRDVESTVIRPDKELKAFAKIELQPGEQGTVSFTLDKRAFAYYNVELGDWHVESGQFMILIGTSSQNIVLEEQLTVHSTVTLKKTYTLNSTVGDLMQDPASSQKIGALLQQFGQASGLMSMAQDESHSEMLMAMMRYMPLRSLLAFGGGAVGEEQLERLLADING
ncbi:glycoside hydrolase family 3 C-terminal domain-containing protein [Paenibacillus doosanensis]|uniref:beta-glucosidase n=1 Tax=Paenibacillus doosanensis TaxID=1229154 RepID=UPI00217F42B9|nr:glycoside hydrolase family 3 C-terminal domain-containing protein [Paenibacillus doosanensis]MCS7460847.1 glycoside hydrolase family 3 C-terminal domain-containing protein [Paenibacillus doosanensis]